jgi:hypothetical protein
MRCFYHPEEEAVGGCKSCGKGLCPACAVDLGKGLACRQRCEADVRAMITLIEHNIQMAAKAPGILRGNRQLALGSAILFCALGTAFLAWGLLVGSTFLYFGVVGSLFLVFGVINLGRVLRMPQVVEPPAPEPEADAFPDVGPDPERLSGRRSG